MREAEVRAVLMDPNNGAPVVLLQDRHSSKVLPIWIGHPEALSIAAALERKRFPRPMSHDLMKSLLEAVGARVEKVIISDLKDNVFYATIYLRTSDGTLYEIDARPSDSVALALRADAPIYISEDVFDQSAMEFPDMFFEEDQDGEAVIESEFEPTEEEEENTPEEERQRFEEFVDRELNLAEFKRYID